MRPETTSLAIRIKFWEEYYLKLKLKFGTEASKGNVFSY